MDSPPSLLQTGLHRSLFRSLAPLVVAMALAASGSGTLMAGSEDVSAAILKPAGGPEPAIFFKAEASANSGIGDVRWVATAGSPLSRKGTDPWGQAEGAFGLPEGATSGSAISGATQSDLLTGAGGAVIFFFKAPDAGVANAILLTRGTWEKGRQTFDLRAMGGSANRVKLYSGAAGESPKLLDFGRMEPSAWNFVALTWTTAADGYELKSFVAPLAEGSTLEENTFTLPAVGLPGQPLCLAGRFAPTNTTPSEHLLLLEQGLYTHLAIYQDSVPDAAIRAVFEAALKGLAP